jgi:cysteine desulfurase
MEKQIFLDHASTTPIARQALNEIIKTTKDYANPSSKHNFGQKIRKKIEDTRKKISVTIGCNPNEIFFNSGGTEGNNTIIKGLAEKNPEKKHIIISKIEHPSILEVCNSLEKKGYIIDKISVNKEGIIDLEELKSKINPNTLLVSVMHVNNEIGTIQPIEKIAIICKKRAVYFHSDMVQSLGKLNINLKKINLDFASFSGHKINAPKGIGFMYIKKGIEIEPLIHGGNQEKGIRSGTENFLGIISLPIALNLKRQIKLIKKDRDHLLKEILKIPGTVLNGSKENRIYNNINVSFYGIEGESLMMLLSKKGIFVSTGSACSSNKLSESHVLKAIDLNEMYLNGSIRITIDRLTNEEKRYIINSLKKSVEKLQEISPFKYNSTKQMEVK